MARLLSKRCGVGAKVSFFCAMDTGKEENDGGKTGSMAEGKGGAFSRSALRRGGPDGGGSRAAAKTKRAQRAFGRGAEVHGADFFGAVRGFSGDCADCGGGGVHRPEGRGERGGHFGGDHHERDSGNGSDREGRVVAGKPEKNVRPHSEGAARRRDSGDSGARSRGGRRGVSGRGGRGVRRRAAAGVRRFKGRRERPHRREPAGGEGHGGD
ncbi:hypothetical protein SDC9_125000 [bioreactor metagenome]|uniref:Uncharacterized protein n=1 Tax=bioreactor metagenome TaxID=1076179 RepID=A0A645CLR5_9ZZZZ